MRPDPKAPAWKQAAFTLAFGAAEVGYTWAEKGYNALSRKSTEDDLLDKLKHATTYEQWYEAAFALDSEPETYDWRVNPIDSQYDYRLIEERRNELCALRLSDNVPALANCLRQGLLRNLFNITKLPLFSRAYAETKDNIRWYIEECVEAIHHISLSQTVPTSGGGRLTAQEKLDVLYESQKSFGRTALLLQGGSIFGLCHLGVVKAMLAHGVLPKVVVGTATGALMAALISVHTVEELPEFLSGTNLNLQAFAVATAKAQQATEEELKELELPPSTSQMQGWMETLEQRAWRLVDEGFLLDPEVLAECIKDNVGDITFREAYERTDRVLNIIISSPSEDVPNLMNYLTAPDVLIRSAAMASHVTNMARMPKAGIQLLYKAADGTVTARDFRPGPLGSTRRPHTATDPRKTPLSRLRQQFNIDHFVISQARPYVAPFLKPSLPYVREKPSTLQSLSPRRLFALPDISGAIKHGALLVDILGWLPESLRRVLSDELITGDSLTLVPELFYSDYLRLLKNPTREEVDYWIMRGERSVWPSLCALKVRCMIEMALDSAYERVRRRKEDDPFPLLMAQMQARPMLKRTLTAPAAGGEMLMLEDDPRRKVPQILTDREMVESDDEGTVRGRGER